MAKEVGRPTKMTDETVMKLEQAFAIDATVEEACSYADISRNTFYVWLKEHEEYQDRIDELRQRPMLKARQTIVKSLDTPEGARWYLARKKKQEFSEKIEQEHSNPDGNLKTIIINKYGGSDTPTA